jgi:hypothetical protein
MDSGVFDQRLFLRTFGPPVVLDRPDGDVAA